MDIAPGDRLALLPTSYQNDASDDVIVETYDSATGVVTVNSTYALKFYHWGAPKSTGDQYGGADMRGEVIMLTRNIKIMGQNIEGWGGHILIGDAAEINDDGTVKERIGNMYLDWVELYNLSQIDTEHAAVRWENAAKGMSEVTNCSIHNGYGWGVLVKYSNNVLLKDNRIFNFRPVGVVLSNVKNVTFDRNVVAQIQQRTTFDADKAVMDRECGVCTCTFFEYMATPEKCEDTLVTNNIVAGAFWVGMTL